MSTTGGKSSWKGVDTPVPKAHNIDARHWHIHLTTFWVLLAVFIILFVATVICSCLFAYGPYLVMPFVPLPLVAFPKWTDSDADITETPWVTASPWVTSSPTPAFAQRKTQQKTRHVRFASDTASTSARLLTSSS